MKTQYRRNPPTDEGYVEDYSGENWDDDVLDLLRRETDTNSTVFQTEPPPLSSTQKENDLSRANLSGATLNEAHLNGAELMLAQLSHAELRRAHLVGAHLTYANLFGADLQKVNLTRANLSFADLSQADLRGAKLNRANLENADLRGADLRGADLVGVRLTHTQLSGSMFDETTKLSLDRTKAVSKGMIYIASEEAAELEVVPSESEETKGEEPQES